MRPSPTTLGLLIALAVGFFLQQIVGLEGMRMLMLWPFGEYQFRAADGGVIGAGFMPWQLVTYSFLHADLPHLLFNALGLWTFGAAGSQRGMSRCGGATHSTMFTASSTTVRGGSDSSTSTAAPPYSPDSSRSAAERSSGWSPRR